MGNGHMGTPREQNDRHLLKHYLPATSFVGGKDAENLFIGAEINYWKCNENFWVE